MLSKALPAAHGRLAPPTWPQAQRQTLALPVVALLHALVLLALLQTTTPRRPAPAPVLALLTWVKTAAEPALATAAPRLTPARATTPPPALVLPIPVVANPAVSDDAPPAPATHRVAADAAHTADVAPPAATSTSPGAPRAASTLASAPTPARKHVAPTAVQYLVLPPVEVPRAARRAGESGVVWLRVVVDVNGLPALVQLHRSSGHVRLDEQALWAMRQARFRPQTENGQPVELEVIAPIEYLLE